MEFQNTAQTDRFETEHLFQILDRGIDDMEADRELSISDAFQKITELRNARRNTRL